MKNSQIIVVILLVGLLIDQVRYMKQLLIPSKKTLIDLFGISVSIIVILGVTHFYAEDSTKYTIGGSAIVLLIVMCLKQGISKKGFLTMRGIPGLIKWEKVKSVEVYAEENIRITISANLREEKLYFKKDEYNQIVNILKEKLPKDANLNVSNNF